MKRTTFGVIVALLSVVGLSSITPALASSGAPVPPIGSCAGAWLPPAITTPFALPTLRPGDGWGPYPGFNSRELWRQARTMPEYGDAWDHDTRRLYTMTFTFTADSIERLEQLRAITPFPGNLRARSSCFGIRDLRRHQDTVGSELHAENPPILASRVIGGIGIDASSMRVYVQLLDYSPARELAIEARYGPSVCVPRRNFLPAAPNKSAAQRRGLADASRANLCAREPT